MTGGIAAYKAAELCRLLVKDGIDVQVVMTRGGLPLHHAGHPAGAVRQAGVHGPVGRRAWTTAWPTSSCRAAAMPSWSRRPPRISSPSSRTALADDLLSTLCLARECPLLVAPAMNRQMWENAATQRNVAQLRADGVRHRSARRAATRPAARSAWAACWRPRRSSRRSWQRAASRSARRHHGADHRRPDLRSHRRGARHHQPQLRARWATRWRTPRSRPARQVTLVSGRNGLTAAGARHASCRCYRAQDMLQAVNARGRPRPTSSSASRPWPITGVRNPSAQKIKKDAHILTLELVPNPDILANVAARPKPPFCVGFAAESQNLEEYAEDKRRRKKLPLLVANLRAGRRSAPRTASSSCSTRPAATPCPRRRSSTQARRLVAHIAELYRAQSTKQLCGPMRGLLSI